MCKRQFRVLPQQRNLRRDEKEVWSDLRREQRQCESPKFERTAENPTGDLSRRSSRQKIGKGLDYFSARTRTKGITVRKKFRRGSTEVDGLSYFKDGQSSRLRRLTATADAPTMSSARLLTGTKTAVPAGIALAQTDAAAA